MYTQNLDSTREILVIFGTLENVHGAIDIFGLVFSEIEVDGVEDVVEGNGTVKGGEAKPSSEVISWDVGCYPGPDF